MGNDELTVSSVFVCGLACSSSLDRPSSYSLNTSATINEAVVNSGDHYLLRTCSSPRPRCKYGALKPEKCLHGNTALNGLKFPALMLLLSGSLITVFEGVSGSLARQQAEPKGRNSASLERQGGKNRRARSWPSLAARREAGWFDSASLIYTNI